MINCQVEPMGLSIGVKEGETLHDSLERSGIHLETPCGGNGICGSCRVRVVPCESVPSTPHEKLSGKDDARGVRLACQAVPKGDLTLHLPGYFADKHPDKILLQKNDPLKQSVKSALRIARHGNQFLLWYDGDLTPTALVDWKPEFKPKGLAIDIGTTTMVVSLVCLDTGKILDSGSSLNPQVIHGHDVLTRIQYARTREGLDEMAALVQNKLNSIIFDLCQASHALPAEILDVTIGANTTMLQLAARLNPASIGLSPFTFDIQGGTTYPAGQFGLSVNAAARVYLPPVLHAYVGSDISAGLILCPDFFDHDSCVLFIDMGTNGEICLNVKGNLFATSTAAGPAFEGMGLSTGMRARAGAVERVESLDNAMQYYTIGSGRIQGICGSGIIDLIAVLLELQYLDPSGRLIQKNPPHPPVVDVEDQLACEYGTGIYLTQRDIRQIQLAKAALKTGLDLILDKGGIGCDQVSRIYIAGGFGNALNPVNMEKIGLLPKGSAGRVIFCGNASIDGSTRLLINRNLRSFIENALDKMTYLQLAKSPRFLDCFLANLNFPV